MAHLPKNLPQLLRAAGLTVVEVDDWYGHGRPGPFDRVGTNIHHTGASAKGWSLAKELAYARWMFRTGRPDLSAPLCQIALGRSGTVYIGASGRANHAGTAKASGSVAAGDGNSLYIGIEWMLSGTEEIPEEMMSAGVTLVAVLQKKVNKTSERAVSAHYQTSVTGKWDIGDPNGVDFRGSKVIDMNKFRAAVAAEMKTLGKRRKKNVVALTWNAKVGRKKSVFRTGLAAFIKANDRPAIIALNEVRGYRKQVKAVATARRYHVVQGRSTAEKPADVTIRSAGSSALLIRRDMKVRDSGFIRTLPTWVGPKGGVQEGREIPWVEVRIDGKWTLVAAVHMPTGRNRARNRAAWDAVLGELEALAFEKGLPLLFLGDFNVSHRADDPRSIRALAKRIGARLETAGLPIDYAVVKGHPFKATKAARRGSDHHAFRLVRKK